MPRGIKLSIFVMKRNRSFIHWQNKSAARSNHHQAAPFFLRNSTRTHLIITVTGFAIRPSTVQLIVTSPRPRNAVGNCTLI